MAVYKDEKTNTWRVLYRYTGWNGERKQSQKRGFKTKREAQAWEREQINRLGGDLDMTFKSFVQHYAEDIQTRIKENTWATKDHIIKTKLLPYFGKLRMSSITPQQIIKWQNELLNYKDENGKPFSPVYLKTIQNQLSAIFNHAARFYNLKENPCKKAGSMGKKKNREMLFWTKAEYLKFADAMMDKPVSFYAFEMLYWCGIREGELLALTPADFDFEKQTVTISKSFQHLNGRDTAILINSIFALLACVGSIVWGWIDQKWGTKVAVISYCIVFAVAFFLNTAAANLNHNIPLMFISIFMFYWCIGGTANWPVSLCASLFGRGDFMKAQTPLTIIFTAGRMTGFSVIAFGMSLTGGSLDGGYLISGVLFIIALIVMLFLNVNKFVAKHPLT